MAVADTPEDKREKALEKQIRNNSERPSQERKRNVFNGTQGKLTINYTIDAVSYTHLTLPTNREV